MKKINIFIQCRTSSTRFPNKIFTKISNDYLIEILIKRVLKCKKINDVILLAPKKDKKLINSKKIKIPEIKFFYGSENNVFERFFKASLKYKSKYIVRLTSDCPLVDPSMIESMIDIISRKKLEYISNTSPPTFPDGLDIEIFDTSLLKYFSKKNLSSQEKEHVTLCIKKMKNIKKGNLFSTIDMSESRITVDYKSDLKILHKLSKKRDLKKITYNEICKYLREINEKNSLRNEKLMINKTQKMWLKANKFIPGGNSLLSKNPKIYDEENWPSHFESASGIEVKDLDGKKYLDFSNMGVGTNILGYNNKKINKFVVKKLQRSNMSSLNCPEEVMLAEKMVKMHPWSNKALFTRTGAEANAISVRLARAYNKKNIVLICGYHGWSDWYLSANFSNKKNLNNHLFNNLKISGVDKSLKNSSSTFEFNDLDGFKKLIRKQKNLISAVIMEVKRDLEPKMSFLKYIRSTCTKNNIVLIFDECTSGFRENFGGIHLKYGIKPDIAMFGKALGNGFAINMLLGKSEMMEKKFESFISSTFWTERIGPSAGLKTLKEMESLKSWKIICRNGIYLRKKISNILKGNKNVFLNKQGIIPNLQLKFSKNSIKKIYINYMLSKGILASDRIYLSISHNKKEMENFLFNFKLFVDHIKKNNFMFN